MLTKLLMLFKTYNQIHATPQYLTWKFIKSSIIIKQYQYGQLAVLFFIFLYLLVSPLRIRGTKQEEIIIGYIISQFIFFAVYLWISHLVFFEPKISHRIYQILMISSCIINQVVLLLQDNTQQIMPAAISGCLSCCTIHSLPELKFKLLISGVSCGIYYYFDYDKNGYFEIVFFILLASSSFFQEYNQIALYLKYLSLFSIIERIPNAMCIVNNDKTQMIYSNEQFDNLASALNKNFQGAFSDENEFSEQIQLNFLQNLSLTEIKNEGFKISDILDQLEDEGTNEQFKIKNVYFGKERKPRTPTIQPSTGSLKDKIKKNHYSVFKTELQSLVSEQFQDQKIKNQAYIADIILQMELQHEPCNFIQSAFRKRSNKRKQQLQPSQIQSSFFSPKINSSQRRKSKLLSGLNDKQQTISLSGEQFYTNQKDLSMSPQNLKKLPENQFPTGTSEVEHKLKFMVQLMQNCNFFLKEEELQIFFISELSPIILKTKVKKLEQVKKDLLRSISHELVTYLNGAQGYLDQVHHLMQIKNYNKDDAFRLVTLSQKYLKLQIHKIQDIFDFKELLNGQFQLNHSEFCLEQTIKDCIFLMQDQSLQKQIILQLSLEPVLNQPLRISGDKQRLCQVLLNLLSNAIRFTDEGSIIIQIKKVNLYDLPDLDDHQFLLDVNLDNIVEIRIIDTGLGMEKEQLGTLTKKLLSVNDDDDEKVSKDSVGISMGLMLCKQILKRMAPQEINSLFVKSVIGAGSSFYFFLKLLDPQEDINVFEKSKYESSVRCKEQSMESYRVDIESINAQRIKDFSVNQKTGCKEQVFPSFQLSPLEIELSITSPEICYCNRILIVDDESFNIDILSFWIKQMGFDVDSSYNGKQCLEKIDERLYNQCNSTQCSLYKCILMDINMPVLNGFQTALRINQMQQINQETNIQIPKIPIIAVTAFGNPQDKVKCLQSGFDHVIVKPATKQSLIDAFAILQINYTN